MKTTWITVAALAATLHLAPPADAQTAPTRPTVEQFFQPPTMSDVQLSPSGRYLAFLAREPSKRQRLIVLDTQTANAPPQVVALFDSVDIATAEWVSDDLLIFSIDDYEDIENRRRGGGLYSVQRDGKNLRMLIKREVESLMPSHGAQPLEANFQFERTIPGDARRLIVSEVGFTPGFEVKRLTPYVFDLQTRGKRLLLTQDPPHERVLSWWFDRQGQARVAMGSKDGVNVLYYAAPGTEQWREIDRSKENHASFGIAFPGDDDRLYVNFVNPDTGLRELREFDLAAGKVKPQALVTTPGFDATVRRVRDRDGQLVGLRVLTDAWDTVWMEPAMRRLQAEVDRLLPGRVNLLDCVGCAETESVLVQSYSDRQATEYLHYHGKTKTWQNFGPVRPSLDERLMATTALERIRARDGLEMPVWVTQPAAAWRKPGQPLPTIVLVHGGPWVRGRTWAFDNELQFLASRGYLVIEPEFRGSTGYGSKLFTAGWQQWGQAMQDDLADALAHAVKKGWADPARTCIAGASYGGYAALMGAARQSDLFRCAISWVGVTDPRLLFSVHWSDISRETKEHSMPELVGDPVKDDQRLAGNAPVNLAGQIKMPVLLAYGGADRRVPLVHGEKMRAALTKAGNAPEWIEYDEEGHGWRRLKNQVDFWTRVERFLERNLAPR